MGKFLFIFVVATLGRSAFADVTCSAGVLLGHRVSSICSSVTIPENGAISTTMSCNGYAIKIDCDLHSSPNKLTLQITAPSGETKATSIESEVHLTDADGNGAVVGCSN